MSVEDRNIVLHVDDVHKTFGGLHALADIDLTIEEGKTHAIIGPNGAGKSTLLNVIVGRLAPTRGAVVFDGAVLTGKAPHQINQLGIARVFQTPEIFPDLSVLENVMAPAFARRDGSFKLNFLTTLGHQTDILEDAEQTLEDVGLTERMHHRSGSLSRGRQAPHGAGDVPDPAPTPAAARRTDRRHVSSRHQYHHRSSQEDQGARHDQDHH